MQEIISCPSCQRKLQVPDALFGQDVQCPTCGATFTAGGGAAPAPPPPMSGPAAPEPVPSPGYDLEREPGERPPRRRRSYDEYDREDDYDDQPRRRRRDLLPHRG